MASNGTKSFIQTKLFINNEYVNAKSGETLSVYNPADESLIVDNVEVAGEADVDAAVDAAAAAFKGEWSTWTGPKRSVAMLKMADLIDAHAKDICPLETKAMGMPLSVSGFIVKLAADIWRYYAGWTDKIAGEQYPADDGVYNIVQYEPLGVCAGIGAWNASVALYAFKTAAAVAAGNTTIYKGSEKSPLGILTMGALAKEAGFPPGVINIITGDGKTGAMLASHMNIQKISFTGSVFVGKKVQELAAKSNLKRVTLELGGKSPSFIFDDADIENALTHHSQNFLFNTGQICVSTSRTFVHEAIAPKFIEALKGRFEAASNGIGIPMEPMTFIGPLADKKQFDRVMEFIEIGKGEAELITGGTRKGDKGWYVEPTIFLNPKVDARIYREEIFGPVMAIRTFKTEEEAIELANDTNFGLSACVFTTSVSRALRIASKIEAGTVNINSSHPLSIGIPFGGKKQSGIGREAGKAGLLAYMETKTININMNV
ncbi:aldehyde dehydrogenase [Lepidopterella palustris CBS 459.81]|uniref:aldehyde dehydrogenase (NAD(+)) n=1 Tax=Lepidopterella palustris CBS 459.81 TaxID=1314670 RepID=A0A8E2E7I5_9PEZI|nr:aldehyde dehydrogenase [Lepidopterella palustris CBS 459.81]